MLHEILLEASHISIVVLLKAAREFAVAELAVYEGVRLLEELNTSLM